jgi:hypothetical protein
MTAKERQQSRVDVLRRDEAARFVGEFDKSASARLDA